MLIQRFIIITPIYTAIEINELEYIIINTAGYIFIFIIKSIIIPFTNSIIVRIIMYRHSV